MNKNERPAFLKGKGAAVGVVLCFVAAIMMVGSYTFDHYKKNMGQQMKDAQTEAEKLTEDSSALANTDDIIPGSPDSSEKNLEIQEGTRSNQNTEKGTENNGTDVNNSQENSIGNEKDTDGNTSADETQSTTSANAQAVWFTQDSTLSWPASGATLLSFSMDHTVYFPTLEQYKYNPALIIGGTQGEVINAAAAGIVESVEETAQTGTTVTLDMGNGYTAVYGQLDEVPVAVGDYIAAGDEVGTLNAPTKYYSVEGTNLYFEVMKDGAPVDPMNFME